MRAPRFVCPQITLVGHPIETPYSLCVSRYIHQRVAGCAHKRVYGHVFIVLVAVAITPPNKPNDHDCQPTLSTVTNSSRRGSRTSTTSPPAFGRTCGASTCTTATTCRGTSPRPWRTTGPTRFSSSRLLASDWLLLVGESGVRVKSRLAVCLLEGFVVQFIVQLVVDRRVCRLFGDVMLSFVGFLLPELARGRGLQQARGENCTTRSLTTSSCTLRPTSWCCAACHAVCLCLQGRGRSVYMS